MDIITQLAPKTQEKNIPLFSCLKNLKLDTWLKTDQCLMHTEQDFTTSQQGGNVQVQYKHSSTSF